MEDKEIRGLATKLKIPFLVHFTRANNLKSILLHGLYPVADAAATGIEPEINDAVRFDRQPDATSISIAFPNNRMFYRYRMEDESVDWAVLVLHPKILWTKQCAFCQHNAADNRVSRLPIADRMTGAALAKIYEEFEGHRTRAEQKLKDYDPTDEQAEVLVFDVIEPALIVGAAFNSETAKAKYEPLLGDRKVVRNRNKGGFFGTRSYNREY